jgi:hypothetical protein
MTESKYPQNPLQNIKVDFKFKVHRGCHGFNKEGRKVFFLRAASRSDRGGVHICQDDWLRWKDRVEFIELNSTVFKAVAVPIADMEEILQSKGHPFVGDHGNYWTVDPSDLDRQVWGEEGDPLFDDREDEDPPAGNPLPLHMSFQGDILNEEECRLLGLPFPSRSNPTLKSLMRQCRLLGRSLLIRPNRRFIDNA